jgi:hypothetical protein
VAAYFDQKKKKIIYKRDITQLFSADASILKKKLFLHMKSKKNILRSCSGIYIFFCLTARAAQTA